ncbi:hypothetical protein B0H16DRAFT_1583574 [Mycena metata]|uniref:Uncharacterized protein n=1 Tax=Mycena metata TaxID=1033252 RepID=A0AAD7HZD8_9AGAR|nr:hypothetical protein B0H16DRAFT_1583574 [Mycena metata]
MRRPRRPRRARMRRAHPRMHCASRTSFYFIPFYIPSFSTPRVGAYHSGRCSARGWAVVREGRSCLAADVDFLFFLLVRAGTAGGGFSPRRTRGVSLMGLRARAGFVVNRWRLCTARVLAWRVALSFFLLLFAISVGGQIRPTSFSHCVARALYTLYHHRHNIPAHCLPAFLPAAVGSGCVRWRRAPGPVPTLAFSDFRCPVTAWAFDPHRPNIPAHPLPGFLPACAEARGLGLRRASGATLKFAHVVLRRHSVSALSLPGARWCVYGALAPGAIRALARMWS